MRFPGNFETSNHALAWKFLYLAGWDIFGGSLVYDIIVRIIVAIDGKYLLVRAKYLLEYFNWLLSPILGRSISVFLVLLGHEAFLLAVEWLEPQLLMRP